MVHNNGVLVNLLGRQSHSPIGEVLVEALHSKLSAQVEFNALEFRPSNRVMLHQNHAKQATSGFPHSIV